ncbi:MAG: homoserine dehydrogenase [Bacteroidetes bacterium]|nr:homoserine dehydrogenase [Bacteroidota bacterium]
MKKVKIGLFGFGTVGEGLYEVIKNSEGANAEIVKICVKTKNKKRSLPEDYFTCDSDDIFNNKEVNIIVELIDDAEESYKIVKRALLNKIPVVSGNKKMIAYNLPELIDLQEKYKTPFLYDASACGSIPVIRNLEEYYDNDLLLSVKGILNGSSNFILSKIFNENMSYDSALRLAQSLGFAESNPVFDVGGYDTLFKLVILTIHAFGIYVSPDDVLNIGINKLNNYDIRFAKEKGWRIKLLGEVIKKSKDDITLYVMPSLVGKNKYIYSVEDEFNGVVIKGSYYDKQFMFGKGAGGYPTGSAVLSDITATQYNYRYEYKKLHNFSKFNYTTSCEINIYFRYIEAEDIKLLNFINIEEKFWSKEYSYVVGTVKLCDLIKVKNEISKRDIFIATIQ